MTSYLDKYVKYYYKFHLEKNTDPFLDLTIVIEKITNYIKRIDSNDCKIELNVPKFKFNTDLCGDAQRITRQLFMEQDIYIEPKYNNMEPGENFNLLIPRDQTKVNLINIKFSKPFLHVATFIITHTHVLIMTAYFEYYNIQFHKMSHDRFNNYFKFKLNTQDKITQFIENIMFLNDSVVINDNKRKSLKLQISVAVKNNYLAIQIGYDMDISLNKIIESYKKALPFINNSSYNETRLINSLIEFINISKPNNNLIESKKYELLKYWIK
jgi:hypothetical protein